MRDPMFQLYSYGYDIHGNYRILIFYLCICAEPENATRAAISRQLYILIFSTPYMREIILLYILCHSLQLNYFHN